MIRQSHIERRSHLALHCNQIGLTNLAIEIGVYRGDFSAEFAGLWEGKNLHLVDPWCTPKCDGELSGTETDFDFVKKRFINTPSITLVRKYSEVASFNYGDNSVDFIYIDADHTYESVYNDLFLWWPKLHKGGILAGHDFFVVDYPGLTEAVMDFARRNDRMVHGIFGDRNEKGVHTNSPSWYMYK